MTFRNGFYAGLVVAVVLGIYLAQLWQAPRQVELHSVHLLSQVEKKNWKAVGEFVGSGYQDRWGNDRALLLERLRDIFRVLPSSQIEFSGASTRTQDGQGYW